MPTWVKVLLIVLVAGILCAGVAIFFGIRWARREFRQIEQEGPRMVSEAEEFGRGKDGDACVTESLSRLARCDGLLVGCVVLEESLRERLPKARPGGRQPLRESERIRIRSAPATDDGERHGFAIENELAAPVAARARQHSELGVGDGVRAEETEHVKTRRFPCARTSAGHRRAARHSSILDLARNLGLDERRELQQRLLPAEIAHLEGDGFRNSLLND